MPLRVSSELRTYLAAKQLERICCTPFHPMTLGKIERYHLSIKYVVELEVARLPRDLDEANVGFIHCHNEERSHGALDNLAPADVYSGRGERILNQREAIKQHTLAAHGLTLVRRL